jgi:hypothetical protein
MTTELLAAMSPMKDVCASLIIFYIEQRIREPRASPITLFLFVQLAQLADAMKETT